MARLKDINVRTGAVWTAKVSNKVVEVKITSINKPNNSYTGRRQKTTLTLLNLSTGKTVSRTAAALRTFRRIDG